MNAIIIEKKCSNCSKQYGLCENNHNFETCENFNVKKLLVKIAASLDKEIKVIESKKYLKNNYLYKSDVEDWKDHHKNIWRLKLKLTPEEWCEIKQYFKYYKNRNLVGWGTTSPVEVTEILTSIKGSDESKEDLEAINTQIAKVEKRQSWGYEHDVFGDMDYETDKQKLAYLKSIKRDWLGVIWD